MDKALQKLSIDADTDWLKHARPDQLTPPGNWQFWLALGGRGAGKTRIGAEWVRDKIKHGAMLGGLIAPTTADVRKVMVAGPRSGILSVCSPYDVDIWGNFLGFPEYEPSNRQLTWANGAACVTYSAEEPNRLRGPQHEFLWCYITTTQIATPNGHKSIENLVPGNLVLTRKGPRRVLANGKRQAVVGRVTFDNGAELVGTADHPLWISSGWTRLDHLQKGDSACAIVAWNGVANFGTATGKVADRTTNAPIRASSQRKLDGYTSKFGKAITDLYRKVTKSITRITTKITTLLTTLNAYLKESILSYTGELNLFHNVIGQRNHLSLLSVSIAEPDYLEKLFANQHGAPAATNSAVNKDGQFHGSHAFSAENISRVKPETIAVSVASTWQRMGVQDVYCLKVECDTEYFANSILVHNCDELAAWDNGQPDDAWDMAMFGLRVGDNPQALITTTPRPIPLIRELMKSPLCVTTRHKTADNKENLAPTFLTRVVSKYAGTRLGRQELEGEVIDEVEGALWTRGMIEKAYMRDKPLPDMKRIVIGVDPATTSRDVSALTGIVVAGLGVDNRGYVLADYSGRYSPGAWARQVADAFTEFDADRIIAEGNQGGEMVRHTIETAHPNLPVTIIHAKEAKQARAEPIAALYEQGRISHAEAFPELEDQLMTWAPLEGLPSPDRLDAMVWALRNLMLDQWVDNTQLGMVSITDVRVATDF